MGIRNLLVAILVGVLLVGIMIENQNGFAQGKKPEEMSPEEIAKEIEILKIKDETERTIREINNLKAQELQELHLEYILKSLRRMESYQHSSNILSTLSILIGLYFVWFAFIELRLKTFYRDNGTKKFLIWKSLREMENKNGIPLGNEEDILKYYRPIKKAPNIKSERELQALLYAMLHQKTVFLTQYQGKDRWSAVENPSEEKTATDSS